MQRAKKLSQYGFAFAMIVVLFLSAIDFCVSNQAFFAYEYNKQELGAYTRMSESDYLLGTQALVEYVKNQRDDIQVVVTIGGESSDLFNQREIDHMVDVKGLYIGAMYVRNILLFVALICAAFLFWVKDKEDVSDTFWIFKQVSRVMGLISGILVFVAVLDFDFFWVNFHKLFFTNDLWLLDPRTDWMIRMFPLQLFNDMVFAIVILFVLGYALTWGILRNVMKRGS
ncbi:MAG: TIGR01906 family membrane protein [Erysipelotrichaceae bacterium]